MGIASIPRRLLNCRATNGTNLVGKPNTMILISLLIMLVYGTIAHGSAGLSSRNRTTFSRKVMR